MKAKAIFLLLSSGFFLAFSPAIFSQSMSDSSAVLSAEKLLFSNRGFLGVHLGTVWSKMRSSNNLDNPRLLTPISAAPEIGFSYMFYFSPNIAFKIGMNAGTFPVGMGEKTEAEAGQSLGSTLRTVSIETFLSMPVEVHYQHKLNQATFARVGIGGSMRTFSRSNSSFGISSSTNNVQSSPALDISNIEFGRNNPDFLLKGVLGLTRVMRNYQMLHLDLAYHFSFQRAMESNYQFINPDGSLRNEGLFYTNGSYLGLQLTYNLSRTNLYIHDQEFMLGSKTDLRRHWQAKRTNKKAEKERQKQIVDELHQNPDSPSLQKLIKRPRFALHYQSFLSNTQANTQTGAETFRTKVHHGFSLGLRYHQPFSSRWRLVTGLEYGEQYFYYEKSLPAADFQLLFDFWDYNQDFNSFINIPVFIQRNSYLKNRWIWQNRTGISFKKHFNSGFTEEGIYKSNVTNTDNQSFTVFQVDYQFTTQWFLNLHLSTGFQKVFRNSSALSLDLNYNFAPSKMMESPYVILPDSPQRSEGILSSGNSFVGLSLEYLLPMRGALRRHSKVLD